MDERANKSAGNGAKAKGGKPDLEFRLAVRERPKAAAGKAKVREDAGRSRNCKCESGPI